MSACANCPDQVPVVSARLAQRTVAALDPRLHATVKVRALVWLVTRHEGLSLYEGINGRPYENWEKDLIALETGIVAGLPCPFHVEDEGCLLGGLGPAFNRASETGHANYGWLPTALMRLIDRETLRELVARREIADAKVAMLTRNEDLDPRVHMGVEPPAPRIPTQEEVLMTRLRTRGA